jgi:hypothetical protein
MTMLRMCAYVADLSKKTKMKVNRGVQEIEVRARKRIYIY